MTAPYTPEDHAKLAAELAADYGVDRETAERWAAAQLTEEWRVRREWNHTSIRAAKPHPHGEARVEVCFWTNTETVGQLHNVTITIPELRELHAQIGAALDGYDQAPT